MKSCNEYRELFDAYIDRELDRMERMELEAHCEECPECAKELSQLQKLFEDDVFVMPHSVSESVMERVKASSGVDFFTGEDTSEAQRIAALKKAKKREGMKAWGIIAACFILLISGSIFTRFQKNKYAKNKEEAVMEMAPEEAMDEEGTIGNENTNASVSIAATEADALQEVYDAIYLADRLEVKFVTSKVSLYERFYIEYFADYLAKNECVKLDGIKMTDRSIGYIKTDPEDGLDMMITDKHKIVFSFKDTLYVIDTDSDELLYALEGLGLHG